MVNLHNHYDDEKYDDEEDEEDDEDDDEDVYRGSGALVGELSPFHCPQTPLILKVIITQCFHMTFVLSNVFVKPTHPKSNHHHHSMFSHDKCFAKCFCFEPHSS